jgi:hypothetical protein
MKSYPKEGRCAVCGGTYTHWGNNPAPLTARTSMRRLRFEERVCDKCNTQRVIPARIRAIAKSEGR